METHTIRMFNRVGNAPRVLHGNAPRASGRPGRAILRVVRSAISPTIQAANMSNLAIRVGTAHALLG